MNKIFKHNGWNYILKPNFLNDEISISFCPENIDLIRDDNENYVHTHNCELDAENLEKSTVEAHEFCMNAIDNQKALEELSDLDIQDFAKFKRKLKA